MTVLNIHAGGAPSFSLRLKDTDSPATIKQRAAKKLQLSDTSDIRALYEYVNVRYTLDDEDDFEVFQSRTSNAHEVNIFLGGNSVPVAEKQPPPGTRPHMFSPQMRSAIAGGGGNSTSSFDSQSIHSNASRSPASKATSIHLIASSDTASNANDGNDNATIGGKSTKSNKSTKTLEQRAVASGVPVHKLAFDDFHSTLGVRTFIGSIGPIENVRMMMKDGHRHCYMAREFALQHGFIPKDAAPGFYGFSGITNLGSWPIKVGSRSVDLQVMLIENSYFPVILGRSFQEKRRVQIDPLDQTHIIFQDVGEIAPCDIVVVKDASGNPIPIS